MVSPIKAVNSSLVQVASRTTPTSSDTATSDISNAKSKVSVDFERMQQNLQVSIDRLNEQMLDGGRNVIFYIDQELGRPIVEVRNRDTGEIIRQIPTETVVRVAHNIEALKGLLMNKKI
jgi:flagellar protein FlaG